ncbi:hypothetical protein BAE44_0018826 [Dichanthelium oligosanthes]|uniref:PGG domain-containing protein n=1 Tax=Dichanthelium oligosanthes TaxID=888268 RepID=A0A1E5V536_9POAL|nr:hypothetical protein BAE44_0018826 [Dichanthelium oligosanthes]
MVIQTLRDAFSNPANMTPEMKKSMMEKRMKLYKIICFFGAAVMTWIDKAVLLDRVYQYNHTAAQICTVYLTIALVSMLLGIIASSFPDTAPCAMGVAWNGTLQVFLFLIALVHINLVAVYPELLHLTISFILISVLLSIYWFFCARDPTVRLVEAAHHE